MNFIRNRNFQQLTNTDPQEQGIQTISQSNSPEQPSSQSQQNSSSTLQKILQLSQQYLTIKHVMIFIVCVVVWWLLMGKSGGVSKQSKSFREGLVEAINGLEQQLPRKFVDIDMISQHSQLPLCIIIDSRDPELSTNIQNSIKSQQYQNYKTIQFPNTSTRSQENPQQLKSSNQSIKLQKNSYYEFLMQVGSTCPVKCVLVFAEGLFTAGALKRLSDYYQNYNTWVLYDVWTEQSQQNVKQQTSNKISNRKKTTNGTQGVQIFSVYRRVFQLLHRNDFYDSNKKHLAKQFNSLAIMTGLFELSRYHSLQINSKQIFQSYPSKQTKFMHIDLKQPYKQQQNPKFSRIPYENMHTLSQNYHRGDLPVLDSNRYQFYVKNKSFTPFVFNLARGLEHHQMQRTIQLEQAVYLPDNHSIGLVEIRRMEAKYRTGDFQTQLPLCININSHDNQENNRYQKVMESVVAQNYSNYHIVFIDDFSSDQTLNLTKKYLQQTLNFPRHKVTYVRNLKRKYLTYNTVNAAFSFCAKDSIYVQIDGDDKLIGKQVFKFINAQYQANDIWLMYNFYIDDKYSEGFTHEYQPYFTRNFLGRRSYRYYFSALRSFKTTLFRKIPLRQHQDQFGNFFDTLADAALQHPIFELSGQHIKCILQPVYFYFGDYGNNDGSSVYKDYRRELKHVFIWLRSPLEKLETLDGEEDQEVRALVDRDRQIQYMQV